MGQQFYCRNYTLKDGLPDNSINDIFQDSRGFLWIGTNAGLSRFDGENFKNYISVNGLASDYIISITENNKGEICIACKNGGLTKIFADKIYSLDDSSGLVSNNITKLYFSKKFNLLFIGTEEGLNVLNDDKIITIDEKTNLLNYKLHIINFLEIDDYIYVFTKQGKTFKYNPFLENISPVLHSKIFGRSDISSAFINMQGDTLINTNYKSLELYDTTFKKYTDFGVLNDYKDDNKGNTWIVTSNDYDNQTILKYNKGKFKAYNKLLNIQSQNILSAEYNSTENILWLGTKENGLFLYPLDNYSYYNEADLQLNNLNIIDLYSDETLWICTEKEIIQFKNESVKKKISFNDLEKTFNQYKYNYLKSKYSYLIDENGSYKKYESLISKRIYKYNNPYIIFKNNLPVVLPDKSLYKPLKYDIITNKKFKNITGIIGKKDQFIWIGSNVGVFKYDIKNSSLNFIDINGYNFIKYGFSSKNELIAAEWDNLIIEDLGDSKSTTEIYNNYEDGSPVNVNKIVYNNDNIWFSTLDHGIYVKTKKGFISSYKTKSLDNIFFNDLCVDKYGNTLAAGNNGKIYFLEVLKDSIISKYEISSKDGLQGTSIRWIHCINNQLFIGTNAGLDVLNLESFYNSTIIDLEYNNKDQGYTNYSGNVAISDKWDNLWIGANKQLIKKEFSNNLNKKHNQVNYFIQSIEVNNKPLNLQEFSSSNEWALIPTKSIILPYYKNSLTFYFDIIHFLDPNSITFRYKLEGYSEDWSNQSKDRKIVFQNLPSGTYKLRIKIFDNSIIHSNQEVSVKFIIKSPYWKKWYFFAIGIVILFILTLTIIQLRTNSIKKRERIRAQIAERITEFEMKALRAQMNPHFIFNAINSIQNYMLDNDVDSALNYLSDFAKLIRITLDNVSKKKIDLEDELNYLKYYLNLEKMRYDKNFETEIILPKELESRKIMIPPMIIQPFIENSIKYGFIYNTRPAKIKIEFKLTDDNFLKCIIEDNGIGRKKSKELSRNSKTHKSKSTYITQERFILLNQTQPKKGYYIKTTDLYDEHNFAKGTKVEITIPI